MSSNHNRSEDDQDITSSRKHHKKKQKRKASIVSLRDGEETKTSRTSKWKQSLAQIKQEISDNWEFITKYNSQLVDNDHPSTIKLPQHEQKEKSPEATLNLMQMTLDERDIIQSLQQTQDDVKLDNEETIEEEKLCTPKEKEKRNLHLEEKLDQDDEFGIRPTMDLSSLNLTDNDIPQIMQRLFRKQKKNYTNLVLRDNALTSIGVKILVDELLTTPTCLRNLGLSSNPGIGDAGIEHLVRLLQGNRSITLLALHNTGITDRGVHLLADVLCDTNTDSPSVLEKLYISFNKLITDHSLEALIQILEQNQTLKVLSLQRCSLSDKARRRLRQIGTTKKKRKFSLSE